MDKEIKSWKVLKYFTCTWSAWKAVSAEVMLGQAFSFLMCAGLWTSHSHQHLPPGTDMLRALTLRGAVISQTTNLANFVKYTAAHCHSTVGKFKHSDCI